MSIHLDYDYLDRVQRAASLYTKRKTSDLLEGDYQSSRHGRSLDFDDLREYHFGDDVKDIDWKSSSRVGKTLVRRYYADRKHDVIFVGDTGRKMTGDTPSGESKEQIALMAFAVTAYLMGRQGVNCALSVCGSSGSRISRFLSGPEHLMAQINAYKNAIEEGEPSQRFYDTLLNTASTFARHMIMVVITDSEGLSQIDERLVRRLTYYNDVYILKIKDAYLTMDNAYDLDSGRFADSFLSLFRDLHAQERRIPQEIEQKAEKILTPNRVFCRSISKEAEIIDALVYLFERRKGLL
ncbi:MAG TPA: hypothetical protein DCF49_04030 [Lachnospiraceae bacterium]|nr:hypothetical protein [Lachnospiraceae bacterium]